MDQSIATTQKWNMSAGSHCILGGEEVYFKWSMHLLIIMLLYIHFFYVATFPFLLQNILYHVTKIKYNVVEIYHHSDLAS